MSSEQRVQYFGEGCVARRCIPEKVVSIFKNIQDLLDTCQKELINSCIRDMKEVYDWNEETIKKIGNRLLRP